MLNFPAHNVFGSHHLFVTTGHVQTLGKKPLSTSKNVLYLGHNHLLITGADDPSLIITFAGARLMISIRSSALVVSRWL